MSLYKQFKTESKYETEGVLLEYGKNSKDQPIRIRVARAGGSNTRYAKTLDIKTRPYRRQIQQETLDPAQADLISMDVYATAVVLGWENVEDDDGNPIPFSREACLKLFQDLPDLFQDIREQSQKVAVFRAVEREADAKN